MSFVVKNRGPAAFRLGNLLTQKKVRSHNSWRVVVDPTNVATMASLELEISTTAAFCWQAREAAALLLRQRIETQAHARS